MNCQKNSLQHPDNTDTKATNIIWHSTHVEREYRDRLLKQCGCTIWFTGLPSSGKSTTAFSLEYELIKQGYLAYVLDGDNVRHGLNKNLGFSPQDREENIRRIAEVARLFADAGIITIASFISPYRKDRDLARKLHIETGLPFVEVFIDTSLEVCEDRDPKGLYQKARKGELKGFTGIDDPYEPPQNPELVLKTEKHLPDELVADILAFLVEKKILNGQATVT
jgi:adenylylsulfate kinase